jgi:hypothetical protein
MLGGVKVRNVKTGELTDLPISGLFFAIGETIRQGFTIFDK